LEFDDQGEGSFYSQIMSLVPNCADDIFITISQDFAEKLADSQRRTTIPGGYCLIGNGHLDNKNYFVFIIKAEMQEVFNIKKNRMKIIQDVFLSPAKDFYKIGFFVFDVDKHTFIPYMYDDQFNTQKKDLTEYFYSYFLGLTTERNAKLKTKNFFEDTLSFIKENVSEAKDSIGLQKALTVYMREINRGYISSKEFSDLFLGDCPNNLQANYNSYIQKQGYSVSFMKDLSLLSESRTDIQRVNIGRNITLTAKGAQDIRVLNTEDKEQVQTLINDGSFQKVILLRMEDAAPI
jgi:hypothetical protein